MRRLLFFLLGLMLVSVQLLAQSRTVTGKVADDNGVPVPGASVVVAGTKIGTVTNGSGIFTLSIPENAKTLVISGVGYTDQQITIGSQTTFSVNLKTDSQGMENIVVTGYTREKKSQFAGAATTLSAKVVESVPVGSFDQALQGRAPGLLVNSSTGQPGSSPTITIRGVQSIQGAGAQPLFILDGVPLPSGDMQSLNPNDFESITILKDANAAALYGARGGTGVIVITTKKGKTGGTNFTARSQVGFTQAPNFSRLNMMSTPEILLYEERLGLAGAPTNTPGWVYSKNNPAYNTLVAPYTSLAQQQARYNTMLDSIRQIDTDLADVLYRQGISQTHELNMSGGSDRTRFYLSGGYFKQEGIDLGADLERFTTRFNIDHTSNKLTVQFNTIVGFSKTSYSEGEWLGNNPRNPFQMTYRAKPYENPFKADGTPNYGANTTLALKQVGNLLEGIENSSWKQNQLKVNSGLSVGYKIIPSVTVRNTFGVDMASDSWQRYIVPGSYIGSLQTFGPSYPGLNSEAYRVATQLINTTSAIFNERFGVHEVEAGAYFEVVRGFQKAIGFTQYNLDPRLPGSGQGAGSLPVTGGATTYPQNVSSARSGFGIRSYFGTARYTYDNRYTLNANIRRDGTSRIANDENRQITTWSAGFIWNALKESFLSNQGFFDDLKLRASYGVIPNIGSIATAAYAINGGIVGVTNYTGPQIPSFTTTGGQYAGSAITGLVPNTPGNPFLKIERIQKTNIGVDMTFWNNRARFSVDAYKNKTVDLFVRQPLSATTGFANLDINAGIMTNKGLEFLASVDVLRKKDFVFTLGINHSINKNNIEDLGIVNEYFQGTFVIREGLPYGSHYTYHYLGADPATGKPRFETQAGGETTDAAQAGQFAKFGTYLPKHVGGFTGEIRFKRFSIDALFSYQFDVVRSNNTRNWITRGTAGYHASVNASRELLTEQWTKPGDNKLFQSPLYDRGFTSSDLEDAKFLRFRNLNISYMIPEIKAGKTTIIKSAKFYVQGQNIAVWSPWRGLDPEDGNNISLNEYPNPRMIVTGIDINF